uniref:NADH dehydrogenase subunit 2 n=1 Tax=Chlorotetraedron incus TaxID=162317 RepID=A0A076VF15_9CHLO|nr:NADH dehydrogenase subunit 2 [Chlorotetraedron incus]AIK29123.1 NADH dehydrogenase subunit 2 [Chlorotetraedron incus]
MTLDVVVWAPEAFLLIGLLLFIWYGSGPLVTPVAEQVFVLGVKTGGNRSAVKSFTTNKPETQMQVCFNSAPTNRVYFDKENNVSNLNTSANVRSEKSEAPLYTPVSGPLHVAAHLNGWAITLCLLTALLVWDAPLYSLQTGGVFLRDLFSSQLSTFLWLFAAVCLILSNPWQKWAGIVHLEYVHLVLFFLMGVHLLLMAADLMALYVCLELQSFAVVVLCSLNYQTAYAIEAGMKYFLLSAFSSCLLLLGIGLIYWQTGLTRLSSLQELMAYTTSPEINTDIFRTGVDSPQIGLMLGLWLVGLGLLWKLAAAPLHMWAADVYMGAWSSVTLMLSTLPKVSVLGFWAHSFHPLWSAAFGNGMAFFSGMSLLIGAVAPLAQSVLKRLLAFSSVGHMGLLLMPFAAKNPSYSALWAHLFLYLVTSLAVWGLIMWPFYRPSAYIMYSGASSNQRTRSGFRSGAPKTGRGHYASGPQYIWDLSGLNGSSPVAATAWAGAMLSLAGLPPVAGFLGKLGLFWWGLSADQYVLVFLALISTLLGSVYYLRILKVAYVDQPGGWGSYGPYAASQGYLVAICWAILAIGLWHAAPLVLSCHLLALAV